MPEIRRDLARNLLAVIVIVGLVGLSLWVLRPFLAAGVWAVMIVVATWPMFIELEVRLGGRRGLAIGVMALGMVLLLVLPLWLAIDTIADHSEQLTAWGVSLVENGLPKPPAWLAGVPLIGENLSSVWRHLAQGGSSGIVAKLTPYWADSGKWVFAQIGGLGGMLVQLVLIVIIAGIFYAGGEHGARLALRFGRRLAGERGENSIILAGQAIRGVALGVGVTAIVQTVLGGIGLAIAGVPFASLLSALMLMFCIAQVGPTLVLLPAVGWMYWTGDNGWATFLLVWSLIVGTLDNFLRPVLIKRGADLPLLLIFAGVIGGMLSFGLVGIFVGPVVLAVTYTLMLAWVEDGLGQESLPPTDENSELAEPDQSEPAAG
jgi:predicted PurR-regulated permease PerM